MSERKTIVHVYCIEKVKNSGNKHNNHISALIINFHLV